MTTLQQTAETFDTQAAGAFAQRCLGILNDGALATLTSIGHQTGLWDTLATLPPATSEQIADAADLDERYVREWLNGMAASGIVEYQPAAGTYRLPAEHAASLTRAAGPDNLARLLQYLPLLGAVEEKVVEAFRHGGGLSYADYPRFHQLMSEESSAVFDAELVNGILPMAEGLVQRLQYGIDVADVGCGSGHAINLMARAFPASRFTGYDISEEGIARGRSEATAMGLANARFEVRDVAALQTPEAYDLVTAFDTIHDQAHPASVLSEVHAALRPGGTFLMVDIKASSNVEDNAGLPWAGFLYTISVMHCMTVSLGQGGDGLGTAWGQQLALSMLSDAGFTGTEVKDVEQDPFNAYYIASK